MLRRFHDYDMDGDGKISAQDYRDNFKKHGDEPDEGIIKYYMQWDKDGDGCLNLAEFRKMCRGEVDPDPKAEANAAEKKTPVPQVSEEPVVKSETKIDPQKQSFEVANAPKSQPDIKPIDPQITADKKHSDPAMKEE